LQPVTDKPQLTAALAHALELPMMPSAGHVATLDAEAIHLDLRHVPLDEVLDFRVAHGDQYRAYMRALRDFMLQLAQQDEASRAAALHRRREEICDRAADLDRVHVSITRKTGSGILLAVAGAAWTAASGDPVAGLLAVAGGLAAAWPSGEQVTAYSYLFTAAKTYVR